ncbi:UNVERIFIED_CONTAM: hypothetical protein PYX00_007622 [Menopon gallinae]|uniref:Uncharacterized protein n=1 Tax=Menopon gallinae TaxID=328185 RepID=A0AAW2HJG1_9NEOP
MIFVIVCLQLVSAERVHVVTPENHLAEEEVADGNVTDPDDTYLKAYRETHNVAERRNPLSAYEDHSYNTLSHSSYIDDDVYPEFSHKPHSNKHRYQSPAVVYGPPSPVSYYHHHHHPEPVSHHTIIGLPTESHHFHPLSAFMHKFGLYKVLKLVAKIVVLQIILKFVVVVALFFFIPVLLPREKQKDESEEDRLLSTLNDITYRVWNSITENESMEDEDKEEEEEEEDEEDDGNHNGQNHQKHDEELDEVDLKLLNKLIREWKEENFGGPDKGSAVQFLERCVNIVNRVLGVMIGLLKMKNNSMDTLDGMMLNRVSAFVKRVVKTWPKLMSGWKAG